MLFETKNNSIRLKFRLLIIGLVSLLWIGCSTEQMRNITGSTPLNAYSVIQGLVTGGSVLSGGTNSSLSSIVFEGGMHVYLESSENLNSNEDTVCRRHSLVYHHTPHPMVNTNTSTKYINQLYSQINFL